MGTRGFCQGVLDGGLRVSEMAAAHVRDAGAGHSRGYALVESMVLQGLASDVTAMQGPRDRETQTHVKTHPFPPVTLQNTKHALWTEDSPVSAKRPRWSKEAEEVGSGAASDTAIQPAPVPNGALELLSTQSTSPPHSLVSACCVSGSSVGARSDHNIETAPAAAEPGSPGAQNVDEPASHSGHRRAPGSDVCSASSNAGSFDPSVCVLGAAVDDADSMDLATNTVTGFALPAEAMAMNAAMHTYRTTLASFAAMASTQQPAMVSTELQIATPPAVPPTSLPHSVETTDLNDMFPGDDGISDQDASPGQNVPSGQAWHHAEDDVPVRLQVAKAVIRLLEAGGFQQTLLGERFLHVVRRLELLLYSSAAGQAEYADSSTMAARLLALVRLHRAQRTRGSGSTTPV